MLLFDLDCLLTSTTQYVLTHWHRKDGITHSSVHSSSIDVNIRNMNSVAVTTAVRSLLTDEFDRIKPMSGMRQSNQQFIGLCAKVPIHEKISTQKSPRFRTSKINTIRDPDECIHPNPPPVTPWSPGEIKDDGRDFERYHDTDTEAGQSSVFSPLVDGDIKSRRESVDWVSKVNPDGTETRNSHNHKEDVHHSHTRTWPFLKSHAPNIVFRPRRSREASNIAQSPRQVMGSIHVTPVTPASRSSRLSEHVPSTSRLRRRQSSTLEHEFQTDGKKLQHQPMTEESNNDPITDYRLSIRAWHMRECISAPPPTASSPDPLQRERKISYKARSDNNRTRTPDDSPRSKSQCTSPRIPDIIQRQLASIKRPPSHFVTGNRRFPKDVFDSCTWGDVIRIRSCSVTRGVENNTASELLWNGDNGRESVETIPLSDELRGILNEDRRTLRTAFMESKVQHEHHQ